MGSKCSCMMSSDKENVGGGLRILDVDLNQVENAKNHHTDKFSESENFLVFRRGQELKVTLKFNRQYDPQRHYTAIFLKTGNDPKFTNSTAVKLDVKDNRDWKSKEWLAWTDNVTSPTQQLDIGISASSNAVVAEWAMEFQVFDKEYASDVPITAYIVKRNMFILFNPWCHTDTVYMPDEQKVEEYVMNDLGKIWRGVNSSFRGMIWNYGQFEPGILEGCMKVLDTSPRLQHSKRGDPVAVCREISAMVNSNDGDNGIVVGNWSGKYEDGKSPTDWQGSVELIKQWMANNQTPVRYGQCWVFAAVLTTVMRAIGIPCRVITNFESAHDTDATLTHDVHVDLEGNRLEDESYDSVWNFHVWNEVWMARPDLPPGYAGWQVVDSTPQERSATTGVYQAGPASVTAVRKGEVNLKYDTGFVFAEVNADKVTWLSRGKDEPLEVLNIDTTTIGQFISTKRPGALQFGNRDRRDVTHRYKANEMTLEERMTVAHAVGTGRSPARNIYQKSERRDVTGSISVAKTPWIGDDFKLTVKLSNLSRDARKIDAIIKLESMLYTGALHKLIKHQRNHVELTGDEVKEFEVTVRSREYLDKLIDQASLLASALFVVEETNQVIATEYQFRVKLPDIDLQAPDAIEVNKSSQVVAQFSNPLGIVLTHAHIMIEGPGLNKQTMLPLKNIQPQGKVEVELSVTPRRTGELVLLASFCSNELRDVIGSKSISVQ